MKTTAQERVIVWGASGHALVVSDILRCAGEFDLVGFLDDVYPEKRNTAFAGSVVLGGRDQLRELREAGTGKMIIAIGDCGVRLELAQVAIEEGFELVTAIHPRAVTAKSAKIGAGTVVAAGAVVGPDAVVGENVIVNTLASVDHHCRVDDGAHVAPGAHIGGGVKVGRATLIGIGAAVRDGITIGSGVVVGAGAAVVEDLPNGVMAYGVPARAMRRHRDRS